MYQVGWQEKPYLVDDDLVEGLSSSISEKHNARKRTIDRCTKSDDLSAEIWWRKSRPCSVFELLARLFQDFHVTVDPGHRTIVAQKCSKFGQFVMEFMAQNI